MMNEKHSSELLLSFIIHHSAFIVSLCLSVRVRYNNDIIFHLWR
jgi:hypothetical protein